MRLARNVAAFIRTARVAHLATADAKGQPHVIPICFVFDGKEFFSPVDEKPKQTPPTQLKRLRNITENSKVSLVIDRYGENWRHLAYALVTGKARIVFRGAKHASAVKRLRAKYPQYRQMAIDERPMIVIRSERLKSWGSL